MESTSSKTDGPVDRRGVRLRTRLECRECEIICERVVSPWHCLRTKCKFVYSYSDGESTYFGCLYKIFSPELDLSAFSTGRGRPGRGPDPYGPVRVVRTPRPHCRVTIEQAYDRQSTRETCCNPTFFHHPQGLRDGKIRLTARSPVDTDPEYRGR